MGATADMGDNVARPPANDTRSTQAEEASLAGVVRGRWYCAVMTAPQLTSVDLFAGAGGLTAGLRSAGFEALYANEIVASHARTFSMNQPDVWVDNRDVRAVDATSVRELLGLRIGELDLLAGGPPCQGFSINAPKRSADDSRNHLFREFLKFAAAFRPKVVLIENVPGLVSFERGATLEAIMESLEELGYVPDVRILYAPHFGVPQTRWRTIVLATRLDTGLLPAFPDPTHSAPARINFTSSYGGKQLVELASGSHLRPFTTVADAIGDLPVLANGSSVPDGSPYATEPTSQYQANMRAGAKGVFNHAAPRLGPTNLERLRHIPAGGNWTNVPEALLPAGMRRAHRSDHTKRYGRANPEGLSSTILTKCDPHWGAYFHWSQDRTFTVREAARIQSFPDTYLFTGSRSEQFEQVGNAVPPLLAEAVGRSIRAVVGPIAQKRSAASAK